MKIVNSPLLEKKRWIVMKMPISVGKEIPAFIGGEYSPYL